MMARRRRQMSLVVLWSTVLGASACSSDDSPAGGNEDTTADTSSDTTADTAADTVDTNVGPPPAERAYYSIRRRFDFARPGEPTVDLAIVDEDCEPGACEPIRVTGGTAEPTFSCEGGCVALDDLSAIIWMQLGGENTLRIAPLGEDFVISAPSEVIATGVSEYQTAAGKVAYRIGQDLRVYDVATSASIELANLGTLSGGFRLSGDGESVFVNRVTLTTMDVSVTPSTGGTESLLYHFVSGEERGTGSFYSGRELMALSPDGARLAVITDALTSANECETNSDCDAAEGFTCLTSGNPPRCTAQQLMLHVIKLADVGQLDAACVADSNCGGDQFCDLTAPDSEGAGVCMPKRVFLGPSGPTACNTLTLGEFDTAIGELGWRDNSSVTFGVSQECTNRASNILMSAILAVDFDSGAITRLYDNPGNSHPGLDCYDEARQEIVPESCWLEVGAVALSPSGQTVAFSGSKPSTAEVNMLWRIDSFGRRERELMTDDGAFTVLSVNVHPR